MGFIMPYTEKTQPPQATAAFQQGSETPATEQGITGSLAVGLAALLIAGLTVSYHALRAAHTNPVDALRYE